MSNRWWTYQRERFPLAAYGALALASSLAALGFSALLRGVDLPSPGRLLAATLSALAFFVQMRVADEFKDREDDARWRPYRPVPRGLVSLGELGAIAGAATLLQLALALVSAPRLLLPLALAWGYFMLMCAEFFAARWLRARPLLYLLSHLPITCLIMLYLSAFDWLPAQAAAPAGLGWLLAAGLATGALLELGRKIRAPADEERGVPTYSAAWGLRRASGAWLATLLLLAGLSVGAAARIGWAAPAALAATALALPATSAAWRLLRTPTRAAAQRLNRLSALSTLWVYLALGPLPLWLR